MGESLNEVQIVDDFQNFFAPVSSDIVDGLVAEHDAMRARVEALAAIVGDARYSGALFHFIEGNLADQRHTIPTSIDKLFDLAGATAHLSAHFWDRALQKTDVLELMPQKRRDEWFEQIRNPQGVKHDKYRHTSRETEWSVPPIPPFTEETVRATLGELLLSRSKFFAERVDGVFRALSREHVTNCPQGFGKRMILNGAISSYGTIDHRVSGYIGDLRCIIARFIGRPEPSCGSTSDIIRIVRKHNGEWASIDAGALRMRVYNGVGTAHLEVHPEMAWRLNAVLASLYPAAIPESSRTRPKRTKKTKDFELFDRPLPFAVIDMLASLKPGYARRENQSFHGRQFRDVPKTRCLIGDHDKATFAEVDRVMKAIGGVPDKIERLNIWRFDYEPQDVLDTIICTGCIPDQKSHQYYPTPEPVAAAAVELAKEGAEAGMEWLEPSAGIGGLADLVPDDAKLQCIEFSELHCSVLKAKGHDVLRADFLNLQAINRFDRVIMNPPFSEGRWKAHVEHAGACLKPGGRLVAILPASAAGKEILPGWSCQWSGVFSNEFSGTSVSVVIFVADKPERSPD